MTSPIAFVHGFSQTSESWHDIARRFDPEYAITTMDLPGHGSAGDAVAADISETAALLGEKIGRSTYIGYSMGGRICLRLALDFPDLVEHLILIGATPGIVDDAERNSRRHADEALADRLDPPDGTEPLSLDDFFVEWMRQPLFSDLTIEQQDLGARRHNTAAGLASSLRTVGTGTQDPMHDRLREISVPTLLIAGTNDRKFADIAFEMKAAIGDNAMVALIDDASHAAPFRQPDQFVRIVESFLDEHPVS